jgi:glycogen synthase
MDEGYLETMAGATFAVMPSLYEPFGAATEPFLAGTPVVARATGGLAEQVLDVDAGSTKATGLLFHEKVPRGTDLAQEWRRIQEAPNPSSRKASILYETLTEALVETLVRAIGIYQTDPARYARMLAGLYDQAKRFSWKRAVQRYEKVYDRAVR